MRKLHAIKSMAKAAGIKQAQAKVALETLLLDVRAEIGINGECRVPDLGFFKVVHRSPRTYQGFGVKKTVPEHNTVLYKPGRLVKKDVN